MLLAGLRLRRQRFTAPERVDPALAQQVDELMDSGLCCSETIYAVAMQRLEPAADPAGARLVGLCGGMGNRQATCGVYTGGAVAIATLMHDAPARKVRSLCSEFQERLAASHSGELVCADLIKQRQTGTSKQEFCHQITRQGSALVIELVEENR